MSTIYDELNPQQREAVISTEGPLLILAGAGSGKTRVLVHRIAYLIEEKGVDPASIMAITFTNKAADEMRQRVDRLIGADARRCWVSTFHSSCVRILRQFADRIGYRNNFSIYDTDDQKRLMKDVYKRLNINSKQLSEKAAMSAISHAKERYMSPVEYKRYYSDSFRDEQIGRIYEAYQKSLVASNAMDFDDLLVNAVDLFEKNKDVLEYWQNRFHYIMVDEYQDTNHVQFLFVKLLSERCRNLCVVGDDDQSIYRFRGADIHNILDFESEYPDCKVIKLEQNYRSTGNILNAANAVIRNNEGRKDKTLWTDRGDGDLVEFHQFHDNYSEAESVASKIRKLVKIDGARYSDIAVLNRTNAQSRVYEEKFIMANIPYKIVGGVNFYARMEVKDILAYLRVLVNPADDQAVKRIINVPRRGIGATTVQRIQDYADQAGISFMDACAEAENVSKVNGATLKKLQGFLELCDILKTESGEMSVEELIKDVMERTGYRQTLEAEDTDEAKERLANIEELMNKAAQYDQEVLEPSLDDFLSQVALVADIDTVTSDDAVLIMTIHSAKGLEFPYVFMGGMEEGVFPGYMSVNSGNDEDMEEERRLCYVGITRAKEKLFMSAAACRMMRGERSFNSVSRFVEEIPEELRYDSGLPMAEEPIEDPLSAKTYAPTINLGGNRTATVSLNEIFDRKNFGSPDKLDYEVGDKVRHIKYGTGEVLEITAAGKDFEVAVDFPDYGIKRMFASFAKLKKID